MSERIRIVVADDHPIVREGLVAILSTQPDFQVVGEAGDGAEVLRQVEALHPDVILLDLEMPGTDGVETLQLLGARASAPSSIVFTAFDTDDRILAAVRAGARGYILKDADEDEILRAIRAVGQGEAIFSPAIAQRLIDFFAAPQPTLLPQIFPELTDREREILGLIAQGHNNSDIARRLTLSLKTVANHVSNIFSKLQVADRAQAIIRAREAGLARD